MQAICNYAEDVKEDFIPVVMDGSIFPEKLVVLLEDALYHTNNTQLKETDRTHRRFVH